MLRYTRYPTEEQNMSQEASSCYRRSARISLFLVDAMVPAF